MTMARPQLQGATRRSCAATTASRLARRRRRSSPFRPAPSPARTAPPPRPTRAVSLATPGAAPDRRAELLHRQVPHPAVPAADLPGRRHRSTASAGRSWPRSTRSRPTTAATSTSPPPARSAGCSSCRRPGRQYGVDANRDGRKDPFNPVDAIFAAARYLKAAGADQDLRRAIFAYNHADWYVDSVLHARARDRRPAGRPRRLADRPHAGPLPRPRQGPLRRRAQGGRAASARRATTPPTRRGRRDRRGIDIFAEAPAPRSSPSTTADRRARPHERLGHYVQLQDVYGNTYTYAHLEDGRRDLPGAEASARRARRQIRRELDAAQGDREADARRQRDTRRAPHHARSAARRRPRQAAPEARRRRAAATRAARACRTSSACSPTRAGPTRAAPPAATLQLEAAGRRRAQSPAGAQAQPARLRPQAAAARARASSPARCSAASAAPPRRRRAAHALRDPPGRPRRPAHRPEADPRRLEAARVDRDLPRRASATRSSAPTPRRPRSARSC